MKTRFLALFFIIQFALTALFAADSTTEAETETLIIKAFKVNSSNTSPEFVITDSLPSSLDVIKNGDEIDVTDYLEYYLGDVKEISNFSEQIIFSYRVAGAQLGAYEISFDISNFTNNSNRQINAGFQLGNINYIFSDSAMSVDETESFEIKEKSHTSEVVTTESGSAYLNTSWEISPISGAGATSSPSQWIARGAVAMTISNSDYSDAPMDEYTSSVTAIFKVVN